MNSTHEPLVKQFRPRKFIQLVGQSINSQVLKQGIITQQFSNCYLFSGAKGSGKTSSSRVFAKALNCLDLGEDGEPCQTCKNCLDFEAETFIDHIKINASNQTGIDHARELIENIPLAAIQGAFKIYVIDECHRLSRQAQDSLLTTLENLPSHVVMIFVTTEPEQIQPTITSRCVHLHYRRVPKFTAVEYLLAIAQLVHISLNQEGAELIYDHCKGHLRDCLQELEKLRFGLTVEQICHQPGIEHVQPILQALNGRNSLDAINHLEAALNEGMTHDEIIDHLIKLLSQVVLRSKERNSNTNNTIQELLRLKQDITLTTAKSELMLVCFISLTTHPKLVTEYIQ